jgi:hypothetical protein
LTLGRVGTLTPDEARTLAQEVDLLRLVLILILLLVIIFFDVAYP